LSATLPLGLKMPVLESLIYKATGLTNKNMPQHHCCCLWQNSMANCQEPWWMISQKIHKNCISYKGHTRPSTVDAANPSLS